MKSKMKCLLLVLVLAWCMFGLVGCGNNIQSTDGVVRETTTYELVDKKATLEQLAQTMGGGDIDFIVNDDGSSAFRMKQGDRKVPINEFGTVGQAYSYCVSTGAILENGAIVQ